MKNDALIFGSDLRQVEDRAHKLVLHTLAPVQSAVDVIAVRVGSDNLDPSAAIGYRATILLTTLAGNTLRSEGCDCDEMLAAYKAIAKIVDQVPVIEASVGDNSSGRM